MCALLKIKGYFLTILLIMKLSINLNQKTFYLLRQRFNIKQKSYIIYYPRFYLDILVKNFAKSASLLMVYNYHSIKNDQCY